MEIIEIGGKKFNVVKELSDGSTVVSINDKKFVLRHFASASDFHIEINTRKKLKKYGINIPKTVRTFKKENSILVEHIADETMLDVLLKEDILFYSNYKINLKNISKH